MRIAQDHILVVPLEKVRATQGGLDLPDTAQTVPSAGRIMMYADKVPTELGFPIQPGDVLVYANYAGEKLSWENVDYIVLMVRDVIGWIPKEDYDADHQVTVE